MRIEPIEKIYPTRNSKEKNHDLMDSQDQREGFQRALQEQQRKHNEERQKKLVRKLELDNDEPESVILYKRFKGDG